MRTGLAILCVVLATLVSLGAAQTAWGQITTVVTAPTPAYVHSKVPDPSETTRPAEPAVVHVGLYAVRMSSVDITNNRYTLDFYIWFRWSGDAIKPYETFEIINGKVESRQLDCARNVGDDYYACVRVTATVSKAWDVRRFPLGGQSCPIEIEDGSLEADQLRYVADTATSGVDPGLNISGWKLTGSRCEVVTHAYQTNYGDTRRRPNQGAEFSRFVFTVDMNRLDPLHSFKVFAGMYLAALVAFTGFFVKPDHRLGVNIGAVFAVVGSHAVISAYLPDAGILTLADKLHLAAVAVILLALFETAYSLHLYHKDRLATAKTLDRVTFWIVAPAFVVANVLFLIL